MTGIFVHPQGICESKNVGSGTRIWGFSHVMVDAIVGRDCNLGGHTFVETGAIIGDRVIVKNGVQIWEGVELDDDVFIGPNATFTNDLRPRSAQPRAQFKLLKTIIRTGATIGANATILCGNEIGHFAFIAAGAVVQRDVPAYGLMAGNPAQRIGWVCACGETLNNNLHCICARRYHQIDSVRGLEPVAE